jgi:predicted permease
MFTNLRLRWSALWKRRQLERDLEDELAFHLAMRDEKNWEGGVAESARPSFGNPELVKEDLRDQWTFRAAENFWRDLRYAARMLRRSPGFTLVAILSLAIGIGANTAIFSVVDAILLKSLPVRDPEQLRVVLWTGEKGAPTNRANSYSTTSSSGIRVTSSFPYPTYLQFAFNVPQFSDLMGFVSTTVTVVAGAAGHYAKEELVTGNFFSGLGVNASAGRIFTPEDDRVGAAPVAVITYRYWERHLGLDPAIIGRSIFVNGYPVTVVGMTPKAFLGVRPGYVPDLYVPMALTGILGSKWFDPRDADMGWVQIVGRLRRGASDQSAVAGLASVMQRARVGEEKKRQKTGQPWRPVLEEGASGLQRLRDHALTPLLVLGTVVGLVLLIACANLANLLLARGVARRREIAVRLSMGAGRWRLVRQLLTESLLLAGLGAGLGLSFASPFTKLVLTMAGQNGEGATIDARLDWRALLFTAAVALLTGLLFGLAPAFRATRVDLTPALKEGAGSGQGSSPQLCVSRLLIAGQVALSTLLLAGAGLFVRTLMNLSDIDPGFQTQRLLLFDVDGSRSGYKGEKLLGLYECIREKVAVIPGVRSVTLSDTALIRGSYSNDSVAIPGYTSKDGRSPMTYVLRVGGHFLTTMGIPVLLGRDLDSRDVGKALRVGVINERFARDYFGAQNPLGRFLDFGRGRVEIVGVSKDAKYDKLKDETQPTVYLPYLQALDLDSGMTFELRTAMPPMAITGPVQRVVTGIDRNVPVAEMRTQEEQIQKTLGTERMFAGVVSSFGVIAALLAAIGLYGVMAYSVTRRTNEIGIRLALGAARSDVQWMVLRESLWMVAAGLAVGIPAALALAKYVQASLYGIKPNDPASFVAAGALMVVTAAVAAWIPARRAARVDPMQALRCE